VHEHRLHDHHRDRRLDQEQVERVIDDAERHDQRRRAGR